MKKITFLIFLTIASLGFSQELLTNGDFEAGSTGWAGNSTGGTGVNVVDDGSGSNFVNEAIIVDAAEVWQVNLQQVVNLDQGQAYQLSFDAYVSDGTGSMITGVAENFGGFGGGDTATPALTTTSQNFSYELTFNNPSTTNGRVFFDMGGAANHGKSIFIDNVSLIEIVDLCNDGMLNNGETEIDCGGPNCDACPSPPTVAAPTPPAYAATDVVSIYSDAYAEIPAINYDAGFCGAGAVTEITPGGNAAFAYNGQACQGIDFDANQQDTSALEDGAGTVNFHVDLFIELGTDLVGKVFNVLLVHPTGDTPVNIDINALSPAPVPGTWYSYDATITLNNPTIRQATVVSNLNNSVWYDNLYLYRAAALSADDFDLNSFNVSPNPSNNVWNIESSNVSIDNVEVYDLLGKRVLNLYPNSQDVQIDASQLNTGIYLAKLSSKGATKTIKLVKN